MKAMLAAMLMAPIVQGAVNVGPVLDIVVTPTAIDSTTASGDLLVEMRVPQIDGAGDAPVLSMNLSSPGLARPQVVRDLSAADAAGDVALTMREPGRWYAARPLRGPMTVRYRMAVENIPMLQGGPPTAPRVDGSVLSGIGSMLFMTPALTAPVAISVDWRLDAMPRGSKAISSFGDGPIRLPVGAPDRLQRGFFMVGPVSQEPSAGVTGGFSSAWATDADPGFDPRPVMQWTSTLHGWMSRFFRDTGVPPYRVFLRYNPMNAGGGAALTNSFLITYGTGIDGTGLKNILGHEMVHTWTANDLGKWYSEGNAVFYQALLSWRAGLISADDYLADVNETASRYYSNALRMTPEEEAVRRFWEDTRVRVLPYDRGALYFAALDGKIRRASGGRRSVDDLIHAMIARSRVNRPITQQVWLDALRDEIGEDGPRLHRAMLAGELILPESGDYGPCFRRTTARVRQFDVGFDFASLIGAKKIVRGLKPGSEAARAGLRDGDEITYGVALDSLQGDTKRTFNLRVSRDGRTFPISYLPRGQAVDIYQWERKPGVECKPQPFVLAAGKGA